MDTLERLAKLAELTALAQGLASHLPNAVEANRMHQLQWELWPQGLQAEHKANPMNHVSRIKQTGDSAA